MLSALIMAGGRGTRFWPMSTDDMPKQFLKLIDENTMLQSTVNRLLTEIDINHIFICTGKNYVNLVEEQLPSLPKQNIIIEPEGRNTAPCILLSCLYIKQIYQNTNIVVLPSDHQINDVEEFLNVLKDGDTFVNSQNDSIITIGIQPDRPETGYGYINYLDNVEIINKHSIKKVNKFVEKPNLEVAQSYLDDGHYLWNAGMFMFNVDFMINEFKKYANETYNVLMSLPSIYNPNYTNELEKKYKDCESISVDFAIMEKTKKLFVIPANFGWDDIGSWKALERYIIPDEHNNIKKGTVVVENSKNNIIYVNGKKLILIDIDDVFCIEANDVIIIGKNESISKIHEFRGK